MVLLKAADGIPAAANLLTQNRDEHFLPFRLPERVQNGKAARCPLLLFKRRGIGVVVAEKQPYGLLLFFADPLSAHLCRIHEPKGLTQRAEAVGFNVLGHTDQFRQDGRIFLQHLMYFFYTAFRKITGFGQFNHKSLDIFPVSKRNMNPHSDLQRHAFRNAVNKNPVYIFMNDIDNYLTVHSFPPGSFVRCYYMPKSPF